MNLGGDQKPGRKLLSQSSDQDKDLKLGTVVGLERSGQLRGIVKG